MIRPNRGMGLGVGRIFSQGEVRGRTTPCRKDGGWEQRMKRHDLALWHAVDGAEKRNPHATKRNHFSQRLRDSK